MINIVNISSYIPIEISLLQSDYENWMSANWKRLLALKEGILDEPDCEKEAVNLFLSFQIFYIYFIYKKIDRIPLLDNYEIWSKTIIKYIKEKNYLGDLEYIKDKVHIEMIQNTISILLKEIRQCKDNQEKLILQDINISIIFPNLEMFSKNFDSLMPEKANRSPNFNSKLFIDLKK